MTEEPSGLTLKLAQQFARGRGFTYSFFKFLDFLLALIPGMNAVHTLVDEAVW